MKPISDDEKGALERLRGRLTAAAEASNYDHRPLMIQEVKERFPHMLEDNQLRYARFKLAIAQVLRPRTIYEVGVGWGVSANAFLAGYPETLFFGIDNQEMGVDPNEAVGRNLKLPCIVVDSAALESFEHPAGWIDLIHLDGGHGLLHKVQDVTRALKSEPEWLLIDDVHDVQVAAGVFAGLYRASPNGLQMLYFENSHTGNLLLHVGRRAPEFRKLRLEL